MIVPTTRQTAINYRQRVCRAMNYISQNIDRDVPLDEVANIANFSKFHFHRIFRAVVGETVAEFTRRLRLEKAANRLISEPGQDITTIAIDCGFSSSQNFAKAFRHHFEMTPTNFRNSKIGNNESNSENLLSIQTQYDPDMHIPVHSNRERSTMMEAVVKELPEYHVAYVRKMGAYGKETCEQAFNELAQWAGPKGYLSSGVMLGVYWDNPEITPPEKCRVDACVSIPEGTNPAGAVSTQVINGGLYGVCHFEISADDFSSAWEDAFSWLVESGYECSDKPCYEKFYQDPESHPEGKWVFDICIPLKER